MESKVRQEFMVVLACVLAIGWACWVLSSPSVKLRYYAARTRSSDAVERWAAIHMLVALGADAVPCLAGNLGHQDRDVRLAAVSGLTMIGDASTLPSLVSALDDADEGVRCVAIEGLGVMRDPLVLPALIRRLDDRHGFVRLQAAIALDNMGCDAGVPEFIRQLDHILVGAVARERLESISGRSFGHDQRKWAAWWAQRQLGAPDETVLIGGNVRRAAME